MSKLLALLCVLLRPARIADATMASLFVFLCAVQLALLNASAFAQEAPPTDCDTYAKGTGIYFDKIDAGLAVSSCEAALQQYPESSRLNYLLGRAYSKARNVAAAVAQYRKAADQGNAQAQAALGRMYAFELGVLHRDFTEALKWYGLAADQGNGEALNDLGMMYANGMGVSRDYGEAVKWFRKAADQGNAPGQYNLAKAYANGVGVPQDYVQAYSLFTLAAADAVHYGHLSLANKESNGLAAKMTSEQIAEAQRLTRALAPNESLPPSPISVDHPHSVDTPGEMLSIPMRANGGVYVVPVLINDVITRNFVVDSGAADVNLTEDVVLTMMRAGILRDSDFLGERTSMVADGRTVPSHTFRIKSLKVGDRVVENVSGAVSSKGFLLLGQSFLGRFKSWSIDNTKHLLVLQ